ncbi:hypothetical protein L3Q82_007800 [Scortum barcoo]|uniref:Uncharacterized protein n=1 Tax=Scortum barcoo TaxID=214431 RepID=A0ACB8WKW9_9TELE|nr:hypothetical protein L3Q82_007800 [Scortum barcoo]
MAFIQLGALAPPHQNVLNWNTLQVLKASGKQASVQPHTKRSSDLYLMLEMGRQDQPPELHRFGLRRRLQALQDCFECTDWEVFKEGTDLDGYTSSVLSYLKFCTDAVLPTKTIKFSQIKNHGWTSTVKPLVKACDAAYRSGDKLAYSTARKELKKGIKLAKSREEIQHLTQWCSNNNLVLNTSKTKEDIVDYRRSRRTEHAPLLIHGEAVERVNNIKFLGIHITSDLTWSMNTAHLVKKAQQRLFFLRKLKLCWTLPSAPDKLLQGHNREQSSASVQQCGMAAALHKTKDLTRVLKTAQGIVGSPLPDLNSKYIGRMQKKARHIAADPTHPGQWTVCTTSLWKTVKFCQNVQNYATAEADSNGAVRSRSAPTDQRKELIHIPAGTDNLHRLDAPMPPLPEVTSDFTVTIQPVPAEGNARNWEHTAIIILRQHYEENMNNDIQDLAELSSQDWKG